MIEVRSISKSFGQTEALKNISFEIGEGELFGLIGPDGAGKTTLLRILATLLIPGQGIALIKGYDTVKDYRSIRRMLGYMPGRFSLYHDLSVEENLRFFASIFNTRFDPGYYMIRDIYKHLEPFRKRAAGKLSGGMKQKLALCCALIHQPQILILDEPTTGVDAVSRKEFWETLRQLKQAGITIIVSTPYMDEANQCDKVAMLQNGKILQIESPEQIIKSFGKPIFAIKALEHYDLLRNLQSYEQTHSVYPFGEYLHFIPTLDSVNVSMIEGFLASGGHSQVTVKKIKPHIEDCFMELMKNEPDHAK